MSRPLVSICIPAYNAERFLGEAIESALLAAPADSEVIVVDDMSSDSTLKVARATDDPRVRVIANPENLGRARNINRGMELAEGETVTVLPADSALTPNSIRDRLAALDEAPEVAFAYGAAQFVDENGIPTRVHRPGDRPARLGKAEAFASLLPTDPVYTITALIRREALHWSGGLRVEIAPSHRDWDFFLRLATHGGLAYTPEVVALERQHKDNFTQIAAADGRIPVFEYLILDAIDRWTEVNEPGLTSIVDEARRSWARTQLGRAINAHAALDAIPAPRSVGLALLADPNSWQSGRFLAAIGAAALPAPLVRRLLRARLDS